MKRYVLENKVMIKGKIYEIKFNFSDEGEEYVKWHNFGTKYIEGEIFYILQITQIENEEPRFKIGVYTWCKNTGFYEPEWYDLDEYLQGTESTVEKIKAYLIKKSDELINK